MHNFKKRKKKISHTLAYVISGKFIFSRNIISCWYLKHFLASLSAGCYSILKIEEVPFLKIEKEQIDSYCLHSRGVGARWAGWALARQAHPLFSLPLLKRDTCTHQQSNFWSCPTALRSFLCPCLQLSVYWFCSHSFYLEFFLQTLFLCNFV